MGRRWVDDRAAFPLDRRWIMCCDQPGCATKSAPTTQQPPLEQFAADGWFIAKTFGDICPACLTAGTTPTSTPHSLMEDTAWKP